MGSDTNHFGQDCLSAVFGKCNRSKNKPDYIQLICSTSVFLERIICKLLRPREKSLLFTLK